MKRLAFKKPKLRFTTEPLRGVLRNLVKEDTLIVADAHNFPKVRDLGRTILVIDNRAEQLERIREIVSSTIIAIGGCTALDIGRAAATGQDLIAVPTILSTDCISVDKSIIRGADGKNRAIQTVAPNETIICFPALTERGPENLAKWSASGLGDLFANIGAAIDQEFQEHGINGTTFQRAEQTFPEIFGALDWIVDAFKGFDEKTLERLAIWFHEASLMISKTGRAVGAEHKLYYALRDQQGYPNRRPTHGQIVAVGTLLTARVAAERTGDFSLYDKMRKAYMKVGLPVNYEELATVGIEREHLVEGLGPIAKTRTLLGDHASAGDLEIVDRVFGEKAPKKKEQHFNEQGLQKALDEIKARHGNDYAALAETICQQIRDYWGANGKRKLVLGLSGGLDSAVVAFLVAKAVGKENLVTLTMPAWKDDEGVGFAELVRERLGSEGHVIDIEEFVEEGVKAIEKMTGKVPHRITIGNIASRTRVNILYAAAREMHGRVLGTGNRTELVQGYAAKYGTPISCDFGILDELYKTDIRELAKVLGVPEEIIRRKPSTGYYEGQTHEEELGAALDEQDAAAFLLFEKGMGVDEIAEEYGASKEFLKEMIARYEKSHHKRMLQQPHAELGCVKAEVGI